jgi:hypothetical protein
MTCQVIDEQGHEISEPQTFVAQARMERSIRITSDHAAYVRWPFYTSPLSVIVLYNPYYPFILPFTTTELARESFAPGVDGLIHADMDLSKVRAGYQLICDQALAK